MATTEKITYHIHVADAGGTYEVTSNISPKDAKFVRGKEVEFVTDHPTTLVCPDPSPLDGINGGEKIEMAHDGKPTKPYKLNALKDKPYHFTCSEYSNGIKPKIPGPPVPWKGGIDIPHPI